jgi:hypothetical protein
MIALNSVVEIGSPIVIFIVCSTDAFSVIEKPLNKDALVFMYGQEKSVNTSILLMIFGKVTSGISLQEFNFVIFLFNAYFDQIRGEMSRMMPSYIRTVALQL